MSFDRADVDEFLYLEARLLDSRAYEEWLELFDEKSLYWIPSNRDDVDPARHVSIVYADRSQLELRIEQLLSGSAWVQDPPSRLCRAVSNIEILEAGEGALAAQIHQIYDNRPNKMMFMKVHAERVYQDMVQAMDIIRGAGVEVIGFVPKGT